MKLNDLELAVIRTVVTRFLSEKKGTRRKQLILEFEDPDLLETMVARSLLRDINREILLPTMLSFRFSANNVDLFANQSLTAVLVALKSLFLSGPEKADFSVEEVEAEARKLGEPSRPDMIWLGLYLARDLNLLSEWSINPETALTSVRVNEDIVKLKNIGTVWEAVVTKQVERLEHYGSTIPSRSLVQTIGQVDVPSAEEYRQDANRSRARVFLSHSNRDVEIALGLIELIRGALGLRDEEIRCTSVDGFRLPAGANTDQVLKYEVREATAFIGLITPSSMKSAYVLFELGARWGAGLHMIPVLAGVGPEALAGPLKAVNCIAADDGEQLLQFVGDLGTVLKLATQSPASYMRYIKKLAAEVQRSYPITSAGSIVVADPKDAKGGYSRKIDGLTRESLIRAATAFVWTKQMPKWTVIVEGKQYPARPLVLHAVGALPNDSTTSNGAVSRLKELGFSVLYKGRPA